MMINIIIFVLGLVGSNYPMKGDVTTLAPFFYSHISNIVTMKKEVWKDVKGYEGIYQASNLGRVKSLKRMVACSGMKYMRTVPERVLKGAPDRDGYLVVSLHLNGVQRVKKIHQLITITFRNHTPCGRKLVVNHINFDRQDNRLYNLEIITTRENSNRKHIKSSSKYTGVCWNKANKKWMSYIVVGRNMCYLGLYKNEKIASAVYESELEKIII